MIRRIGPKKDINFLLENTHYKKLHLLLYLISVGIIVCIYFITLILLSSYFHTIVTIIFSFIIGLYLVFNRTKLVGTISQVMQENKRKNYKKTSKSSLRTTLRKITPKNKRLKLNIKGKVSLKEKYNNIKKILKSSNNKKKKSPEYIEIK